MHISSCITWPKRWAQRHCYDYLLKAQQIPPKRFVAVAVGSCCYDGDHYPGWVLHSPCPCHHPFSHFASLQHMSGSQCMSFCMSSLHFKEMMLLGHGMGIWGISAGWQAQMWMQHKTLLCQLFQDPVSGLFEEVLLTIVSFRLHIVGIHGGMHLCNLWSSPWLSNIGRKWQQWWHTRMVAWYRLDLRTLM